MASRYLGSPFVPLKYSLIEAHLMMCHFTDSSLFNCVLLYYIYRATVFPQRVGLAISINLSLIPDFLNNGMNLFPPTILVNGEVTVPTLVH